MSTNVENTQSKRGRGKNKRKWLDDEDKALIESLQELCTNPQWKCDGNFKSGYMLKLQDMIRSKISNCSLQASPHIESRVKWLKQKYFAIVQMLKENGCKWDDTKKMIRCEKEWYDRWCKAHKDANGLYGMKFKWFWELGKIYDKDREMGQLVETFEDDVQYIEMEEAENDVAHFSSDEDNLGEEGQLVTLVSKSTTASTSTKKKKKEQQTLKGNEAKKQRAMQPINLEAQFLTAIGKFESLMQDIGIQLRTLATMMAHEDERKQQLIDRSNNIVEELMKIEGLTRTFRILQPTKITTFSFVQGRRTMLPM
uniref:Myb/SANT-like domain-containing protein n=1 Tax=Nelumbo nucifera TaxID=4432 RepID=A0A822YUS2_NELNU|nr:TPA_asm: hypothetical protein HUJ06_005961 [Nelumbo nucifera]